MEYSGLVIMCIPSGLYTLRLKAKDMVRYDTHKPELRWWWWTTVAFGVLLLALVLLNFVWAIRWMDPGRNWYIYCEHGMLVGDLDFGVFIANYPNLGFPTGDLPWYGDLQSYRSGESGVYEPWALLPKVDLAGAYFKVPVHIAAIVIVPILAYPFLAPVFFIQRYRRRKGLCLKCGYDLQGNVTGICPECGERI